MLARCMLFKNYSYLIFIFNIGETLWLSIAVGYNSHIFDFAMLQNDNTVTSTVSQPSQNNYYYYYYNRFTTLCPGLPGWVGTRRINHSGFCWSRHDGVAVASAEPYASYLHFAPEDNYASTSSVRFLRAGCPSWHPTNSIKSTEGQHWSDLS